MKRLVSVHPASGLVNAGLLAARAGIAILMLVHGLPKLAMLLSGGPVQFPPVLGMSAELSLAMAVFAEVVCSVLILLGFGTRIATLPLIATMLVAVFFIHSADPFANKELGIHYLLVYGVLLAAGSGKFSLDYVLQRRAVQKPSGY